jgi:uncharacterized protein (TIGR03435 family)
MRPAYLASAAVWLQLAAPLTPPFESSSLKTSTADPGTPSAIRFAPNGGFLATNVTLRELVAFAYQRHTFDRREVKGGPPWTDSARYNLEARVAGDHVVDANGVPQTWSILRTFLVERFKIKTHEEHQQRPVYRLTKAAAANALGVKMRPSPYDCSWVLSATRPTVPPGEAPPCSIKTPPGRLFANTITMASFASLLAEHLDRDVIDATGLTGRFDIELESSDIKARADYTPGPSDLALPPAAGPPMFTALREQLGLTLEPTTAGVPVVIIDAAERPLLQ